MNMRRLITGLLLAASVQATVPTAWAEKLVLVDIKLPVKKAGTDSNVPADTIAEIRVDGLQKGPYNEGRSTKSLDYIVAARGDRHKMIGDPLFALTLDGSGNGGGDLAEDWKSLRGDARLHRPARHRHRRPTGLAGGPL